MQDQPQTPVEKAIFWVEHVIRHKGAPHLRASGLDLKWYQKEMIDVFAFIFLVASLFFTIVFVIIKKIVQCFSCKKNVSNKKKNQ